MSKGRRCLPSSSAGDIDAAGKSRMSMARIPASRTASRAAVTKLRCVGWSAISLVWLRKTLRENLGSEMGMSLVVGDGALTGFRPVIQD